MCAAADACDARNLEIRLTPKENALFHELNGRSNEQIHNIIAKLGESDRDALIHAIRAVKKYFSLATKDIVIRDFREEDVEYIIDRQLSLYASERQFTTEIWKKYLTQGVLDLIGKFDAEKDLHIDPGMRWQRGGLHCRYACAGRRGAAAILLFGAGNARFGHGQRAAQPSAGFLPSAGLCACVPLDGERAGIGAGALQKGWIANYADERQNNTWGTPVLEEKWEMAL